MARGADSGGISAAAEQMAREDGERADGAPVAVQHRHLLVLRFVGWRWRAEGTRGQGGARKRSKNELAMSVWQETMPSGRSGGRHGTGQVHTVIFPHHSGSIKNAAAINHEQF